MKAIALLKTVKNVSKFEEDQELLSQKIADFIFNNAIGFNSVDGASNIRSYDKAIPRSDLTKGNFDEKIIRKRVINYFEEEILKTLSITK